jgi:ATP-dependent DNA helicase RecQ
MKDILFFDLETDRRSQIKDIGAWYGGAHFHDVDVKQFRHFLKSAGARYYCGHNIFAHDLPILEKYPLDREFFRHYFIDTLYLSALLFPRNPYHKLVKDYKLVSEEPNNPVSDSRLAMRLFQDIYRRFQELEPSIQTIYYHLLRESKPFRGFFVYLRERQLLNQVKAANDSRLAAAIRQRFQKKLCTSCDFETLIRSSPLELAYTLALLGTGGFDSVLLPWLVHRHPDTLQVLHRLRYNRCGSPACAYCHTSLDAGAALKRIFGFDRFRRFEEDNDTPLQEQAVNAALDGRSFLAVFPTGGGKSLTFQLPALLKGEACRSLTVVISPLQSLMKDQVDSLKDRHERTDAAAINGLLSPLERAEAVKKVENGAANILYISPESLRSNTILRLMENRVIERFVIDEAHCFSSWGQDFRPDYQYIGEFLKQLPNTKDIPVSCFTATAKPQVVEDIKNYFKEKLGLDLEVFKTAPKRKNLSYGVYYASGPEEKFSLLLDLLEQDDKPRIVYTTRVKRSEELAERLRERGFRVAAYNGRMNPDAKINIQDRFMSGDIEVIVATSAFGMGIDKDDVSMVIHYDIADSLENYIQEAGRAGRDKHIEANCCILFDDNDLMAHFSLLNVTRLNKKEIYQVWQGIKKIRKEKFSRSALELARLAGWDVELQGWETRIKTALAALEDSGLIKRGQDQTRIFATSLRVKNMQEASDILHSHRNFDDSDRLHAVRIIKFIISHKSSGVDLIADSLGLGKHDTRRLINELKGLGIIGDDRDLTAFIDTRPGSKTNSGKILETFSQLETRFLESIGGDIDVPVKRISLKEINTRFRESNIESGIESLRTLLFLWESLQYIEKKRLDRRNHIYQIRFKLPPPEVESLASKRLQLARGILDKLEHNAAEAITPQQGDTLVEFSVGELKQYIETGRIFKQEYTVSDYDQTLLYLNNIGAIKLDRGLFIYYTPYSIVRETMDNKRQYTAKDYTKFEAFYLHRIEQIHIVGEYAKKLSRNYRDAMTFVDDYFQLDYDAFIKKYFPRRLSQIRKPITKERFKELFKDLSPDQLAVINDNRSKAILVAAGPGSGKTRVLVHKVASLVLLEDIKPEQFLMLTYSRAAAMEMRERMKKLLKGTANYIDIYTFHSFAFAIAEIKGDLEQSSDIIPGAVEKIASGSAAAKVENKSVLVIDEFQDIGKQEFDLVRAVVDAAKEIRLLAVGDDDQNIFQFRGSSTEYMKSYKEQFRAKVYHLNTNYRSPGNLVEFSNTFIKKLPARIKEGQTLVSSRPGEKGMISVTKHSSTPLIMPLVIDISRKESFYAKKTAAVLTATNDEALQVYSLLRQQGIRARLLVSYSDVSLDSLIELKTFSHFLQQADNNADDDKTISREKWLEAKQRLEQTFSRSKQLDLALRVIEGFEREHEPWMGIDWLEYLREVNLEDFIFPEKGTVFVSTMHKAKGKEFDHVFVLLDNYRVEKDENIRVIYVAITRAKESLTIHTGGDMFDHIMVPGQYRIVDESPCAPPARLMLQLTHRDVYLDYFLHEQVSRAVNNIQAGDELDFVAKIPLDIKHNGKKIIVLSDNGTAKIKSFLDRNYAIDSITAEYIVAWKKKEEENRCRIVLPVIRLSRS